MRMGNGSEALRAPIGRVAYTVTEAARALGQSPDSLRRMIERHARFEGSEHVARLSAGIVARKRTGLGRWLVLIPPALRAGE
jgi:hypothetical protein